MGEDRQRIHFLPDTETVVPGFAYRCTRCGYATATLVEMWDHKTGLITPCQRRRFIRWLTATIGGERDD